MAATVLVLAGAGGAAQRAVAAVDQSETELSESRIRVYESVLEAVADASAKDVDASRKGEATRWLVDNYSSGDSLHRLCVETTLDGVDALSPQSRFAEEDVRERRRLLRGARGGMRFAGGPKRAGEVAYDAISLAITPFMPEGAKWSAAEVWV